MSAAEAKDALGTLATGTEAALMRFVDELRVAGVPTSISESLDALRAVEHIQIADRSALKTALGTTLVKRPSHVEAFEAAFDIYFGLAPGEGVEGERPGDELADSLDDIMGEASGTDGDAGAGGAGAGSAEDLAEALFQALLGGDPDMRGLARLSVSRLAGMEPGRPVGGTYYLFRTLRGLDAEGVVERLLRHDDDVRADEGRGELSEFELRMLEDEYEARLETFRDELRDEIRRRLVDDRGTEAVAKTLRKPLLEDVDFLHATSREMQDLRAAIRPLARRLATKLAMRRRHLRRGRLDVRRTMRESLASGGVPLEPRFKHPRPHKPEMFLLCDISGSVASFARFTLQLVYAMQMQFSKVRSFVFVDAIDEVTDCFDTDDLGEALARVNSEAEVVWIDGHSDYGHAFGVFEERWGDEITNKSSVIVTGDARNNYHSSEAAVIADMQKRAKHLWWLNPEPRSYWDTGDSIMSEYALHCDGAYEVRNLSQLERFIEELV